MLYAHEAYISLTLFNSQQELQMFHVVGAMTSFYPDSLLAPNWPIDYERLVFFDRVYVWVFASFPRKYGHLMIHKVLVAALRTSHISQHFLSRLGSQTRHWLRSPVNVIPIHIEQEMLSLEMVLSLDNRELVATGFERHGFFRYTKCNNSGSDRTGDWKPVASLDSDCTSQAPNAFSDIYQRSSHWRVTMHRLFSTISKQLSLQIVKLSIVSSRAPNLKNRRALAPSPSA